VLLGNAALVFSIECKNKVFIFTIG